MKIYTSEEITNKLNKKNKTKKIISAIIYPIFIIILVCTTILIVQKMSKPDEIPNLFGYKAFTIVSGSMEPTLNLGDLIIIKKVDEKEIKIGDIISFTETDSVITHRIVEIIEENGEKFYQTKGDNNNKNDEKLVKYEDIEGVYKLGIPKIGNIFIHTRNVYGMIIVFGIIYLIYIISDEKEKRKIYRHEKRKQYDREEK